MFQPILGEEKGAGPPTRNLGVQLSQAYRAYRADTGETGELGPGNRGGSGRPLRTEPPELPTTLGTAFLHFISFQPLFTRPGLQARPVLSVSIT